MFSVVLFAIALHAYGETVVTVEGAGATPEVCRFRAGDASDPFRRWLTSPEVVCGPSGKVSFPAGLWNVFGRSANAISPSVVVDGATPPETLKLGAIAAATVIAQLPAGHTAVLYSPKMNTAYPVVQRTTVPAGVELWLIVSSKGTPVAIHTVTPINAESERAVDVRAAASPPAAIGWIEVPSTDREALKKATGVSLPRIRLTSGAKVADTGTLPPPDQLHGAFLLLPGALLPGSADLQLSGRGWLPYRRPVALDPNPVNVMRQPVIARASARLVVNWSTLSDLEALDRKLDSCEPAHGPKFELIVSACETPDAGKPPDAAGCRAIRTEVLPLYQKYGSVTVDEVPPGTYRAELRYGKLPPISVTSTVAPLQQSPMSLQAYYLEAYGSVTWGGKAPDEDIRIDFPGGGVGFAPRERKGEYVAVLRGLVGIDAKIEVVQCRGERATVLTDRPMPRTGGRYDIDVPDNSLTVTAIDTFTRMTLPSATLRYTVMSLRTPPRVPVFSQMFSGRGGEKTDENPNPGRFVIKHVPDREIRLQVTHPGYKKQDVDPFSVGRTENKEVEVQLVPVSGATARLISARPFERTMIYWFSGGSETERADVAPDGTFVFEGTHLRGETMTVVSLSHPLWITPAPLAERRKQLEVRFPDNAPVRNVEVWGSSATAGTTQIGVVIGGLRVPAFALTYYMALRGLQPFLQGRGPLKVPAIAETGPIDFLRSSTIMPTMVRGMPGPIPPNLESLAGHEFTPVATRRLDPGVDRVVF